MALLSLLRISYKGRIAAAHLEHGFRGASSMADAEFVTDFCREAGITCHVRHVDVAACRLKGESDETAGRRIRYEFFSEVLDMEGLCFVATAHNAGDVAETMAHHFFRGSGIAGLSGITERRSGIVRPLLKCSGEDLRKFLLEGGIPWREDVTNGENHYTRNKIRNQLFPWVRSNINEAADRALLGLADECSCVASKLKTEAGILLRLIARDHPFALAAWDSRASRRLSETQLPSVLRLQADLLGLPIIDRKRIASLCELIKSGRRARFQWAGETEICCDNSVTGWIERGNLKSPGEISVAMSEGERVRAPWGPWTIDLELKKRGDIGDGVLKCGSRRVAIPSVDAEGIATIFDANSFMKKNNSVFHVKMPWWNTYNTPVISWKSENSFENWLPGEKAKMHTEGVYVIIARVFAKSLRCL
jgi:tRNA(Ile)-lysidine synthase